MFFEYEYLWGAWPISPTQTSWATTVVGLKMKPIGETDAGNPQARFVWFSQADVAGKKLVTKRHLRRAGPSSKHNREKGYVAFDSWAPIIATSPDYGTRG
jgi:hypothetical protein